MTDTNKDTIYIDIDDEITAIIDKVRASSNKVVALVLPKRATTLQSIVNMKLLKRSADETKKNLVLITTESGLLPLAGAVGLHVAPTPSSRPEIPAGPLTAGPAEVAIEETADMQDDTPLDLAASQTASVGELAASTMPTPPSRPPVNSGIETLELDNEELPAASALAATKAPKPKKDKHLRVPNFDRFRLLLIFGSALLLLLLVGGYLALVVLPKATISIQTDASNVNTNVDFTLSTTATNFSAASKLVPAKQVSEQKTYTGTATTTGQQNNGQKASGTVTFTIPCNKTTGTEDVPAGTGVSVGNNTYITSRDANLTNNPSTGHGSCNFSASTPITAQNPGASYNTSGSTSFTLSSSSTGSYDAGSISSSGSASGGTDNIQQVVSQADIDNAKGKITTNDSAVQNDLASQLKGQGLYAITATYSPGTPTTTTSNKVGDAASSVTVTEVVTYTMLGANEANLKTLVDNDIKSQINTAQQGILTEGITAGAFKVTNPTANGAAMNVQTTAEVGPSINTANIATAAAGKKSGDIQSDIKSNPDVTNVTVHLSPFWVTTAPKNVNKITVTVAKPTKTANGN